MSDVFVRRGEILALRLFDVAYSIDLASAEALYATHAKARSDRSRLSQAAEKAIAFGDPPVLLRLGTIELTIGGAQTIAHASVRLYDFGAVALTLRIPVADEAWPAFERRVEAVQEAIGPAASATVWRDVLDRTLAIVAAALERPSPATLQEDYLIAVVHELAEPLSAAALQQQVDLTVLLEGRDTSRPFPLRAGSSLRNATGA